MCFSRGQLQVELVVLILEILVHVGESLDLFTELGHPEICVDVGSGLQVEESLLDGGERLHLALEGGIQGREICQALAEVGILSLQPTIFLKEKKIEKLLNVASVSKYAYAVGTVFYKK